MDITITGLEASARFWNDRANEQADIIAQQKEEIRKLESYVREANMWDSQKAAYQAGYDKAMKEIGEIQPIGYIRSYGVDLLNGTLVDKTTGRIPLPSYTRIDPYPDGEDDIPLFTLPIKKEDGA